MRSEHLDHPSAGATCEHYVVYDEASAGPRPGVLVFHQWAGVSDHERKVAALMAERGYVGVAADLFGKGVRGDFLGDNSHLIAPYAQDRALLRRRVLDALDAARAHPMVDGGRVAAIGYCFGGMAALDLARAGAPVQAAVSVHGLFHPPGLGPQGKIAAKVLALHGFEDPMAPPEALVALGREMTEAGADWQAVVYGHTSHAFTARGRNDPAHGLIYNPAADRRSRAALLGFLDEVFG